MLAKQNLVGHDVACRLPDCNNVSFGSKHRVKENIQIALAKLTRGAGNESEGRLKKKKSHVFFEMIKRNQTSWEKGIQSFLVIFCRNHVTE